VTLTAQPAAGSTFQGWVFSSGPQPCSGTGTCVVTLDFSDPQPFEVPDFEHG
jgi:hypothetical protein